MCILYLLTLDIGVNEELSCGNVTQFITIVIINNIIIIIIIIRRKQ